MNRSGHSSAPPPLSSSSRYDCASASRPRYARLMPTCFKHSRNIQGTFKEPSRNIQGTFKEHSRNIQGAGQEPSR
eukprot:2310889-Pyramimonas_sp.AAC.1